MQTIKLGIVGIRDYSNYDEFKKILEKELNDLHLTVECVVSGGAKGVDTLAERWASEKKIPTIIHLPDYKKYPGRYAPIKRNELIVDDAELIIAFWDGKGKGTESSIKLAEKKNKDCIIKYI